jgi:hypothetical protein
MSAGIENAEQRSKRQCWVGDVSTAWFEPWVVKNSSWLALVIIVAALALRVYYADSCYLNPDEAGHFNKANQSSWLGVLKAAFGLVHPPLFILVLHGVLFFGQTEMLLRLPSLVAGTAALSFAFAWMRRSFGVIPALLGLVYLAESPAAISASTEVRQYGLLICFVCGCLYATERIFTEHSSIWAMVQGFFLVGAILTHYTAIIILVSIGLYVLLRSLLDGVPRRIFFTIIVCQLICATLFGFLYFWHVRGRIPNGLMSYLENYYYEAGKETPIGFVWRALSSTSRFMNGPSPLGLMFDLAFLIGVASLCGCQGKATRLMALLIICPFVAGFAAAVLRVFPFAGSRHQTYLLPFCAAGVAAGFARLQSMRASPIILLLGAAIGTWLFIHGPTPDNAPEVMPIGNMTAAIKYVRETVPFGQALFVDKETLFVLGYYLAPKGTNLDLFHLKKEDEVRLGGYRIIKTINSGWAFNPDELLQQVSQSARASRLPPGDPLWVFSVAWEEPSLASRLPRSVDRRGKEFGRISVFQVPPYNR